MLVDIKYINNMLILGQAELLCRRFVVVSKIELSSFETDAAYL
jgi:hypothetical protein